MPDAAETKHLTDAERHELLHRLAECEKAAQWYITGPRRDEMSDIIYLYQTMALLGRAVAEHLRRAE
jgi:hypothetical protein